MATRRYSVAPQDNDHTLTVAAGLAVVTKSIELTVDWDGLISAGLSTTQARLQVLAALEKIHAFIETTDKLSVAG